MLRRNRTVWALWHNGRMHRVYETNCICLFYCHRWYINENLCDQWNLCGTICRVWRSCLRGNLLLQNGSLQFSSNLLHQFTLIIRRCVNFCFAFVIDLIAKNSNKWIHLNNQLQCKAVTVQLVQSRIRLNQLIFKYDVDKNWEHKLLRNMLFV